jgi:hypothetical protein
MSDFVDKMKQAVEYLEKAQSIFNGGPLEYYLTKLVRHSEALMGYAKFKIGDKAVLKEDVPCKGGWQGSEKDLSKDSVGTIVDVDYHDGEFVYIFVPTNQWWQTFEGAWKPKERKNSYALEEKWFYDPVNK